MSVTNVVQEAEKLISTMTRGEKARILQIVARDLGDAYPGIEKTPGICGGEARIVRTRIPVWVLEQARRLGMSESDLLRAYPTGIIVCTFDPDFTRQAKRIHKAMEPLRSLDNQLIRVI